MDGFLKSQRHPLLIDRQFLDFDEFEHALRYWNVRIHRLDRGRSENRLFQFNIGSVQLAHGVFTGHTRQEGVPPQGLRTVAILSDSRSKLIWRKKKIPSNGIMVFPLGSEVDVVTQGDRAGVFTMSFAEGLLTEIAQAYRFPDWADLTDKNDLFLLEPYKIDKLRTYLIKVCQELAQKPAIIEAPSFQKDFRTELPRMVLSTLSEIKETTPASLPRRKARVLKKLEDFFEKYTDTPLTVRDLCRIAEISDRTLLRQDYAIALPAGSALREPINVILLQMIRERAWQSSLFK